MAKDARDVAVMALTAYRKQGVWPDVYLKSAVAGMDVRDAALATNITYGVMQNRMLLDFYIKSMSSIGMSRIAKRVLDILRVGLYQLYFLDKVPEYAVVDGAVRMARRENERISG
ncbi:MAG: transcription antitermination factor NusB, partial [Clostridia bacterium]